MAWDTTGRNDRMVCDFLAAAVTTVPMDPGVTLSAAGTHGIVHRHGAADGTITACFKRRHGSLRVVDGTSCKRGEVPLSFNQRGPKGDAGSGRAWAYVQADGTVVAVLSKGIAQGNVVHASAGTYCFRNLDFTPVNAVASLAAGAGFGLTLQTNVAGTAVTLPGCGTDTSVFIINPNTFVAIDVPFFIQLN